MNDDVLIAGRTIGKGNSPYIIAELSANHNGSLQRAFKTLDMAKQCGADAVKIQTYTADTMTIKHESEDFQIQGGLWDGYSLYDLYKWAETPYEWHKALFDYARKIDLTLFSTPFDETAVDLLESLNTPAYKVASFEAVDLPLIKYIAQTGKPMIISTGMANLTEIEEALETAKDNGCKEIILLHCISSYPAPINQSNLSTIKDLADRFGVITGLSDHTLGTTVSIASVSLGACVIEKHVTLDRNDKGPDSEFSLEPAELQHLCKEVKNAWLAIGHADYSLKPSEESSIKFRRSIYAVKDIKEGDVLNQENIRRIRPGFGLMPKHYERILNKKVTCNIAAGTAIQSQHIENF